MGFADGYYYGQGRIICDTSTFSVGDTIRVRSMTDSSKVWNQQVATVGTALVFTVPCYDYYKICTVQNNTEIGGVYKTVDYGQTLFINVLDKTTLGGVKGIVNAHQEGSLFSIGDELTIDVNGTPWIMQVGAVDLYGNDIIFVSKYIYTLSQSSPNYSQDSNPIRQLLSTFYQNIVGKEYITTMSRKCRINNDVFPSYEDYVWIPVLHEINGGGYLSDDLLQLSIFTTQASRVKTYQGGAVVWATSDAYSSTNLFAIDTSGAGTSGYNASANSFGVLPCFMISADS